MESFSEAEKLLLCLDKAPKFTDLIFFKKLSSQLGGQYTTYKSTVEGSRITGIGTTSISKALRRVERSAGGLQWEYSVT